MDRETDQRKGGIQFVRPYHRHLIDMNGIVVFSTVDDPITGDKIEGESIYDIFPKAAAKKYINTLFMAVSSEPHEQWTEYEIAGHKFIAMVEYDNDDLIFTVHEAPHEIDKINEIKAMLRQASRNYHRLQDDEAI